MAADGIKLYIVRLLSMMIIIIRDRMAIFSLARLRTSTRGISIRQVRLACGLVLFAYLVSHFLNPELYRLLILRSQCP